MKNNILLFILSVLVTNTECFSQTFTGNVGTILDDGSHNYYSLTVSGVTPAIIDANFGLETVCINLTHTWDDDLVISLVAPDGSEFLLAGRNGGDGDNYTNTCFNYDSALSINDVGAPFTGTFKPEGFMSVVNNGQNPNGLWKLHIFDTYPFADTGDLLDWSITFGNNPATPFPFSSTQLPLVVIYTNGSLIPDDPKVMVDMKIIRNANGAPNHPNDYGNVYNGKAGIEQRGNSSGWMPKKSFNFETRYPDSTGLDVSLLDMPEENDWVLIANYSDKSLLRNYYSYYLFRQMGHWAPRMEICEVMIDGEYQGIYLLGERIKKGNDRVDIASLHTNETSGEDLTGGYIFKLDWLKGGDVTFDSDFPAVNNPNNLYYIVDYPKPDSIQPEQLDYIKAYVDSFEYAMQSIDFADTINGFRKYISQGSFVDFIILLEFTKNVDGYRLSTFFHKEKNGKIKAGPPWDYDLSWGNADYMEGYYPGGWNYEDQAYYTDQCPFWWSRFFEDTLFMNRVKCRWNELRTDILNPDSVNSRIDSLVEIMSPSIDLNFTKWPILGTWVWPNSQPIPPDYAGEIERLKDWTSFRIAWLDEHWSGTCAPIDNTGVSEIITGSSLAVFPNPNNGRFRIQLPSGSSEGKLRINDVRGAEVFSQLSKSVSAIDVSLNNISAGIYFINWQTNEQAFRSKVNIAGN